MNLDRPTPRRARTAVSSVWQSHEHATAIKADPSYPTIVQERDALATAPIYEVHVRFSGNPLRAIQAPVTEVDFYKTTDEKVNPEAKPAAETQEMIRRITYRIESLQSPGFIQISWGIALEDGTRGVNLSGWRSVEVRRPSFFAQSFRSTPHACKNIEQSFFLPSSSLSLLTGPHAFGYIRRTQGICGRDGRDFQKFYRALRHARTFQIA